MSRYSINMIHPAGCWRLCDSIHHPCAIAKAQELETFARAQTREIRRLEKRVTAAKPKEAT